MTTETIRPAEHNKTTELLSGESWLDDAMAEIYTHKHDFERQPTMKFEENKSTEISIDFSRPFKKFETKNMKGEAVTKKIIPVTHNGEKKNWWLNVKNPLYSKIIELGKAGQTHFKIMQIGTQANTKYILVQ